jgi:hypothetical protein
MTPQQLRCSDGGGEGDETEREQRLRKLGFSTGDAKSDADRAASRARRAFLATTLSPLASVSLVYLAVPSLLSEKTRQADWYKSNFASKMGGMDDYELHMQGLKKDLFSLVRPDDVVVELGAGLGPNIDMLPTTISYTAVEPNTFMHAALSDKAGKRFVESVQEGESVILGEDMRLVPSASADIVISTLVLCSVPGPCLSACKRLRAGAQLPRSLPSSPPALDPRAVCLSRLPHPRSNHDAQRNLARAQGWRHPALRRARHRKIPGRRLG